MKLTIKIISILLIAITMIILMNSASFANNVTPGDIKPGDGADLGNLSVTGQTILGTIRNIAAVAAVILTAILGIKYMLGSTEEKAEYKKSFIPLIVGIVVVLSATAIADFIWKMVA